MLGEALGAIAALEQESLASLRRAEHALQLARFAGEDQRRIAGKLALDLGERGAVAIDRLLLDRPRSPALGCPAALGHGKTPRPVQFLSAGERESGPAGASIQDGAAGRRYIRPGARSGVAALANRQIDHDLAR